MKGAREKTCVCVWRGNRICEQEQPSAGLVVWSWLKATSVAASDGRWVRDGLGTGSGRSRDGGGAGTIGTATATQRSQGLNCVAGAAFWYILVRSGADFVAGAPLLQGQLFSRFDLRGRRNTFASSGADFVAGAALPQGQVHISWQVRHFRNVK